MGLNPTRDPTRVFIAVQFTPPSTGLQAPRATLTKVKSTIYAWVKTSTTQIEFSQVSYFLRHPVKKRSLPRLKCPWGCRWRIPRLPLSDLLIERLAASSTTSPLLSSSSSSSSLSSNQRWALNFVIGCHWLPASVTPTLRQGPSDFCSFDKSTSSLSQIVVETRNFVAGRMVSDTRSLIDYHIAQIIRWE